MAGKKDIVEQALKLVMGVSDDAAKAGIKTYHGTPQPTENLIELFHGTTPEAFDAITSSGNIFGSSRFSPRRDVAETFAYNVGGDANTVVKVKAPASSLMIDLDLPAARLLTPDQAATYLDKPDWTILDFIENGYSVGVPDTSILSIDRAAGGRTGYAGRGRVVGDAVDAAMRLVMGGAETAAPKVAYHATQEPFENYDWSRLGQTTKENTSGTSVEDWALALARLGPWSHEKPLSKKIGMKTDLPVMLTGKEREFKSLDHLAKAISRHGGPEALRGKLVSKGYGHVSVNDEEFGGKSYVGLSPEYFSINKNAGGRTGYGPGGAIDDIVKMAGKIVSGAEKTPAFKMPPIRPSTDNLSDVGYSNFDHFEFGGDKMLPIENLSGGVNLSDPSQRKRVDALKSAISNPDTGYISRLVVDQDGNVIEGQHRLEALRESGATEAPVSILRDKTAGIDVPKLKAAITSQGGIHSDHVNQLVDMLMDADQYDPPPGFEKFWDAGLKELSSQKGRTGYGPGGFVDDIVKMAGKLISGADEPAKTGIRAYQGSPHDFAAERLVRFPDKTEQYIVGTPDVLPDVPEGAEVIQDFPLGRMRMDKIGTGEGAQAYGHGLYTAEREGVARSYRDALASGVKPEFRPTDKYSTIGWKAEAEKLFPNDKERQAAFHLFNQMKNKDYVLENYDFITSLPHNQGKPYEWEGVEFTRDRLAQLADEFYDPGHMYEVNIAADPNTFLDWDKPLSEQSETVKGMLARFPGAPDQSVWPYTTGNDLYEQLRVDAMGDDAFMQPTPQRLAARKAAAPEVSKVLGEAGIPGIKYLDAGSRGAGEGTRNYVVFDDKLISIIRKYGIAGASAMLGYNLMEQLDPKQALAASMADQEFQSSRPQRSMGGNNSISNALNVARGLHGGM